MRKLVRRLGFVLALGAVLLLPAGNAAAASPAPTFGATLSVDSSCTFTMKGAWTHAKLTEVDITFYMSGVARDPMAVITPVHGHSASATRSLSVDTVTSRDFYIVASFYANGQLVTTATSSTVTVGCGFLL